MVRIVKAGGYDENDFRQRLATPRISLFLNVYGLSIDVFVLHAKDDPVMESIG